MEDNHGRCELILLYIVLSLVYIGLQKAEHYHDHSMNILINHFTAVSGQWTTVV